MTTPVPRIYPAGGVSLTLRLMQNAQEAAVILGGAADIGLGFTVGTAEAWRDAAWTQFRQIMGAQVSCIGAVLRDVSKPEGTVVEVGAPTALTGTAAGTPTVAAGSTLIKWSTSRGGRSGKGRTYLPGLQSGMINADGRTYTASHQSGVATIVNAYLSSTALDSVGVVPAVLSYRRGVATPILAGALAQVVGVQRRRMR